MTESNEPNEPITTDEPEDPVGSEETTEEPGGTTEPESQTTEPGGTTEPENPPEEPGTPCTLIEEIVISHLASELETDNVFAERPADLPAKYYVIEKTSAGEKNHVSRATVAVQSISSDSMLEAARMSKDAEKAMKRLISVANVSAVRLNSAYNFTNPETKEYRYQAVFDIYYMEGE